MQGLSFKTVPDINSHQIGDCVAIVNHLSGWLCATALADDGVRLALSVSIIKALNNLDTILDERERWKLPEGNAHAAATKFSDLSLALLEQKVWAGELNRQVALGNIQQMLDQREVESQPPQPRRRNRKK